MPWPLCPSGALPSPLRGQHVPWTWPVEDNPASDPRAMSTHTQPQPKAKWAQQAGEQRSPGACSRFRRPALRHPSSTGPRAPLGPHRPTLPWDTSSPQISTFWAFLAHPRPTASPGPARLQPEGPWSPPGASLTHSKESQASVPPSESPQTLPLPPSFREGWRDL